MSKKSDDNDRGPDWDSNHDDNNTVQRSEVGDSINNSDHKSGDIQIDYSYEKDPISKQTIEAIKNESTQENVQNKKQNYNQQFNNTSNEILIENKENKESDANDNNNHSKTDEFALPSDLRCVD